MSAYLRAVRFYNDALVDGHLRGRTANAVIGVLADAMATTDPSIFRSMTASANDPNGRVNVASLREDLAFLRDQGLVTDPNVSVDEAVDSSFAEAAVKAMGVYRPHK
jgi:NitT/TauT family transport system substrate-binding protein